MRLCHLIISLLALCAAAHSITQVNISQIFSEIPSCALGCISAGLSSSSACTIANPACLCANQTLQSTLSDCVQDACTQAELIPLAVANNQLCAGFPVQSRGSDAIIVGVTFISITITITLLRFWSRYSIAKQLWWDDLSIFIAALNLVGILVMDIIDVHLGLGEHLWEVQASSEVTLLKIFVFSEVLYILALTFTKLSILFFYLRVFRRHAFRIIVMVVIGFVNAGGLAFILAIIFQCSPVAAAWDKTISAKCIDFNALAFSNSGVSIAQDFIILILPVPELASLQMSRRKKLNVIGMFSIGSLACITSIIRLKFIVSFGNSRDPTWDNVTPAIWSVIEICIAMICACLPAARALLSHWFPSLFEMKTTMADNITSRNATNITTTGFAYHDFQSNWIMVGGRRQQDLEDDDHIIFMSNDLHHKTTGGRSIERFEDQDEVPLPTPPKTPCSTEEGFIEWRSTNTRGSDEVEILNMKNAVQLRNPREEPVVPSKRASRFRVGK